MWIIINSGDGHTHTQSERDRDRDIEKERQRYLHMPNRNVFLPTALSWLLFLYLSFGSGKKTIRIGVILLPPSFVSEDVLGEMA